MAENISIFNEAQKRIVALQEEAIKTIRDMVKGEILGGRILTNREKLEIYLDPVKRAAQEQQIGDPAKILEYRYEHEVIKKRSEDAIKRFYEIREE